MIWLPRADRPLVFARPTSFSLGLLGRGKRGSGSISLADAGGGAGTWRVSVRDVTSTRGVRLVAPRAVAVPGRLVLRAVVSRRAAAGEAAGFVVLTRSAQTRRIPYWLRVTAPRLSRAPRTILRGPGVYRGDTRGRPALVTSYRYPAAPGATGVLQRLPGPEHVFRFVIRRRVENAGAVVLSQGPGSHVSPRLVRGGSEDRLAGFTALPLRINPYQAAYYGIEPVVGVFRPARGAYDLVFDTRSRRVVGSFTFRFWVDDTRPPTVRLLTRVVRAGGALRLRVTDRGSGVDPFVMLAQVDGRLRRIRYRSSNGVTQVDLRGIARGRHRLVLTASDYQETKNTEDANATLPNTRRFVTSFRVR